MSTPTPPPPGPKPDESGGGSVRVSIDAIKQSSARSLLSEASKGSIDSAASTGAGEPSTSTKEGACATGGVAAPSPVTASTPTGGLMSQLAYNHSREARRLLKKEAAVQRSVRGSIGGSGSGGLSNLLSPSPTERMLASGGEAVAEGGGGGSDLREIFASSRNSSISHVTAHGQDKAGGMAPLELAAGSSGGGLGGGAAANGSGRARAAEGVASQMKKCSPAEALRSLKVFGRMLISKYINVLLLAAPFGILARVLEWGPGPVFFLNFVTLIPLASMLGDLTEEVADHMGDTVGGLLNASFGNAVEMVIGVQALVHNEVRVVQSSLLGSVLSNLLLVMGCCFLFGGIRHPEQKFNSTAAVANLSLLFLASIALVVPTPIGGSYNLTMREELLISRAAALFLLAMYIQLLFFQMVTHKHLFTDVEREGGSATGSAAEGEEGAVAELEDEDEHEHEKLGLVASIVGLVVITGVVAVFSEFLVSSIDDVCRVYKISKVFVGVILIPIVGNATEHMTAVTVAYKNRMELAMGIAVGSATQISVFVIPFLVIAGWVLDRPMTLNFSPVELVLYIMSVIITIPVLTAGNSNWIHGSLLITCYLFISFAVWHENDVGSDGKSRRLQGVAGAWEGL